MNNRIIEYAIRVPGVFEKGHPVQRITYSFHDASRIYDELRKVYPENEILIFELSEKEIVRFAPPKKEQPPQPIECPRGHGGLTDKKPNIVSNLQGSYFCKVCGDFFTAPVQ